MKMVRFILSLTYCLCLLQCTVTKPALAPFQCDLVDLPLKDFKIDIFGNLYTVDLQNRLKIYDKDLTFLFEYYNNILGEISHLDVASPNKIALFFSGFQKIIFVDDALSEIGRYEGEYNIIAMGKSRDNNVWIYDGLDYRLKKISRNNVSLVESNPLESYHRLDIVPDYIIEYNNLVYLVEEGKGLAVFDNFGTFSQYIPAEIYSVVMDMESMIYVKKGGLYRKRLNNAFAEEELIKTVPTSVETAYLFKNTIFYLEEKCLKSTSLD